MYLVKIVVVLVWKWLWSFHRRDARLYRNKRLYRLVSTECIQRTIWYVLKWNSDKKLGSLDYQQLILESSCPSNFLTFYSKCLFVFVIDYSPIILLKNVNLFFLNRLRLHHSISKTSIIFFLTGYTFRPKCLWFLLFPLNSS